MITKKKPTGIRNLINNLVMITESVNTKTDSHSTKEHITASKGKRELSFERHGRKFGGWIEGRGTDEVDVVVTLDSEHHFKKGIKVSDKKKIAMAIIHCADILSGAKSGNPVEEDMLLPSHEDNDKELYDEDEDSDGEDEDDEDEDDEDEDDEEFL